MLGLGFVHSMTNSWSVYIATYSFLWCIAIAVDGTVLSQKANQIIAAMVASYMGLTNKRCK